jgi:hypothetical protein
MIVGACIAAAFVLVLGMVVVFRRHWKQKAWAAYWTPNPLHEHQDTVGGEGPIRLFKDRSARAVQITRDADDAQLSALVSARWLIQEKQLRLSKEVLGGGSSGIVKKGTFGSCAVAVKHVSLHFLNMENPLKRRQVRMKPIMNIGQRQKHKIDHRREKKSYKRQEKNRNQIVVFRSSYLSQRTFRR